MDIAASIGPAIRKHREALRLSQEELGERAGVDRTYIGQVERGRRNSTMVSLQRIAHGLGVAPIAHGESFLAALHAPA